MANISQAYGFALLSNAKRHLICIFGFHFKVRLVSKQGICDMAFVARLVCLRSQRNAKGVRKQCVESCTVAQLSSGFAVCVSICRVQNESRHLNVSIS
jgi:hypothetical protein